MIEICLDDLDQATEICRDRMERVKAHVKYIKTIPENKRTLWEKELIAKWENKNKEF